jgi:hypothetical protein
MLITLLKIFKIVNVEIKFRKQFLFRECIIEFVGSLRKS